MIRLLTWLLMGHCHEWEQRAVHSIMEYDTEGTPVRTGSRYVLQCKHCGNMKKYETA